MYVNISGSFICEDICLCRFLLKKEPRILNILIYLEKSSKAGIEIHQVCDSHLLEEPQPVEITVQTLKQQK
jgi:hypothetical protein